MSRSLLAQLTKKPAVVAPTTDGVGPVVPLPSSVIFSSDVIAADVVAFNIVPALKSSSALREVLNSVTGSAIEVGTTLRTLGSSSIIVDSIHGSGDSRMQKARVMPSTELRVHSTCGTICIVACMPVIKSTDVANGRLVTEYDEIAEQIACMVELWKGCSKCSHEFEVRASWQGCNDSVSGADAGMYSEVLVARGRKNSETLSELRRNLSAQLQRLGSRIAAEHISHSMHPPSTTNSTPQLWITYLSKVDGFDDFTHCVFFTPTSLLDFDDLDGGKSFQRRVNSSQWKTYLYSSISRGVPGEEKRAFAQVSPKSLNSVHDWVHLPVVVDDGTGGS